MKDLSEVEFSEEDLARNFPADYSKYVDGDAWNYVEDGIRHVAVKDQDVVVRWELKDGKATLVGLEVF